MKDILTNEAKKLVVVKVNDKGEYVGILTKRTSKYGNVTAVSPFTLENVSDAITADNQSWLQDELDRFVMSKKTYTYADFKIVEMESKTTITFGKEFEVNDEKFRIVNNSREIVRLARVWAKEWRKANPDANGWIWVGTPYQSELKVNPSATDYFKKEFEKLKSDLKWEVYKDYSGDAERDAWNAYLTTARI